MANILVVGTGDIGGNLALTMAQDGHTVTGIRRSDKPVGEGIRVISADVADASTLTDLPENIDIVVYSVAAPVFSKEGYHAYYVKGMKNILKKLKGQTPKRVFFVSSSSVYHQMDGSWVNESSETTPTSFAGKEMLAAEKVLHDSAFNGTSVRFTGIYGPGRERMIQQARHGGYCDPEPPVWTNRIHRDDCIGVLKFLIERALADEPLEDCYLATDNEPATLFDVLEWMKDRIGEVDPDHDVGEVSRRANRRCSNQRLRDAGYEFKYSNYQDGYDFMLNEMGLV